MSGTDREAARQFLCERAKSYLRCDHGDGLNHASFDVESEMAEYARLKLSEVERERDELRKLYLSVVGK